ncbi:solute carrier family 23 protein, partial [Eubacterium aggregans]
MKQTTFGFLEKHFKLSENNTDIKTEVIAGLTTFAAIACILVVNPQVLSEPLFIMGDSNMGAKVFNGVFFATCLISFVGMIFYALYAKLPFANAPGMGLNAFFAFTIVLGMGY